MNLVGFIVRTQQSDVIKQSSVNSTNVVSLPCGAAVFPSVHPSFNDEYRI